MFSFLKVIRHLFVCHASRKLFIPNLFIFNFYFHRLRFFRHCIPSLIFFFKFFFLLLILRKSLNNKGLTYKHTNKFTFNFDSMITFTKFSICNKLFMLSLYHFILACSCNNSKKTKTKTKKTSNGLYIHIDRGILDLASIADPSLRKRYVIEC